MSVEKSEFIFTSEAVTEGHPDKVCDLISDAVLDAHLAGDKQCRVACETLCKEGDVVIAGEISSTRSDVDLSAIARAAIESIGYTDASEPFSAGGVRITTIVTRQAREIDQGVNRSHTDQLAQGAGDQGMMFGYATDETHEMMPLPALLAQRLARELAAARHRNEVSWLRPDGKTQISVRYIDGRPVSVTHALLSTQHAASVAREEIATFVRESLLPRALGEWNHSDLKLDVNPTGSFVQGGPSADAGLTGRKIIADSYGGFARHGGGAFSGKDPSKVDRSGAYFCRFVARQIVKQGLARRAEVQVAYAIGVAKPVSVMVDTFGTGDARAAQECVDKHFDFRPGAIIERLDLLQPIYTKTTNYGHFGKPGLPWEA